MDLILENVDTEKFPSGMVDYSTDFFLQSSRDFTSSYRYRYDTNSGVDGSCTVLYVPVQVFVREVSRGVAALHAPLLLTTL